MSDGEILVGIFGSGGVLAMLTGLLKFWRDFRKETIDNYVKTIGLKEAENEQLRRVKMDLEQQLRFAERENQVKQEKMTEYLIELRELERRCRELEARR